MAVKQINVLYAALTTVAGAAIAAWVAGSQIESPADVAARTAPPAPSPILVPVEERVLSSDIITRGTGRFGSPQPISIAPSSLKGGAGLIATLPARNAAFDEGDVLLTASGRPVFLLRGAIPAYRDLSPGGAGEDVRQLEEALTRIGFDPGPVDGIYDQRTSDAVSKWYVSRGREPFGPTRDQLAALRALERDHDDAMRNKVAAVAATATAAQSVGAARAAADQAGRAAGLELAGRLDDQRRLGDASRDGQSLTVANERAKAAQADQAAAADLAAQIADRALIVLDPRQPETARRSADAKLELARASRRRAKLEGELAIQTAERDAVMAGERSKLAEASLRAARLEGDKNIRTAADAARLAEFDLRLATERAAQLTSDLDAAKRKLGVQVPADEIVFVRSLPVRTEEVTAAIGGPATGSLLTLTDNQLAVDSALPLDAAALVKPGMAVTIEEATLGIKASGVVQTVASSPGTRTADNFHIYFETKVEKTSGRLEGLSVRLTVPIQATNGAVLAVPTSALSLAADGTSRVQAQAAGGALEYVTVRPGLSAGGYVEITPIEGKLAAGQFVVVGYSNPDNKDLK